MNEQNFRTWINDLRTTDAPQAEGYLADLVSDNAGGKVIGYCCLGRGLVCMGENPTADGIVDGSGFVIQSDILVPARFIEWLGVESAETLPDSSGFDLMPGWGEPYFPAGDAPDLTAAGLNDGGFTFSQIADVFEFFGVATVR